MQLGLRVLEQVDDALTVRLSVSDTGIGMSEEHLERLFKALSRAARLARKRYGGTGLGLSICKGLVEAMGRDLRRVKAGRRQHVFRDAAL